MKIDFDKVRIIHFIGIGGVGISALARLMLSLGKQISGTNNNESNNTLDGLRKNGVEVSLDMNPESLPKADLYIYSDSWLTMNPDMIKAAKEDGSAVSYYEALGEFANKYKLVAVCGTHGKTTTTAMLIDIFEDADLDPMGIVGSLRTKTKSNFRSGKGEYFISEADEYLRHFLYFKPKILVITNIDSDHLDYYKDLADIQSAFNELAKKVSTDGFIICNPNDEKVKPALLGVSAKIIDYTKFGRPVSKLQLKVAGEHNRKNASAALACSSAAGLDLGVAKKALENFSGTWRRFEYKGKMKSGALIYDDYAHHPAEIAATLSGARVSFPDKEITIIFQPHLYSRTKILLNDFAEALSKADYVILAPIYAAREKKDENISSRILVEKIKEKNDKVKHFESFSEIEDYLLKNAVEGDLLITMGAGDIYKVGEKLLSKQ